MYFEIEPGGDPNDIKLLFSGQDSITVISTGLSMYLGAWQLPLPLGYAYQISGGITTALSWLPSWMHSGGGQVAISTGTYDLSKTLVIGIGDVVIPLSGGDNLDWSVYYGDVATDLTINNGYLYLTGITRCDNSPYIYCPYLYFYCDMTYNATDDVFISRFKTLIEPSSVKNTTINSLELSLYPNPVQDVFNVSFSNNGAMKIGTKLNVQIINIEGKVISHSTWNITSGTNLFKIDATGLAAGNYVISLSNGQYAGTLKFVKR